MYYVSSFNLLLILQRKSKFYFSFFLLFYLNKIFKKNNFEIYKYKLNILNITPTIIYNLIILNKKLLCK